MSILGKIKRKLKRIFSKKKIPVYLNVLESKILSEKNIIITGGAGGIGLAITEAFLKAGATCTITGRNEEKLKSTVEALKNNYKDVYYLCMDNTQLDKFDESIDTIEKITGKKINVLVNNAGILSKTSFLNITEEDYDSVMNTNLKSTLFLSQSFSKYMIRNNIHGNILNIGSSSGLRPSNSAYTISKWGIRGLTLGMAKTLIKYDIVVNGIAPGPTATSVLTSDTNNLNGPNNDSKRFIDPLEVASIAVTLVSNNGRMIIGDMVNINGGSGTLTFDDVKY